MAELGFCITYLCDIYLSVLGDFVQKINRTKLFTLILIFKHRYTSISFIKNEVAYLLNTQTVSKVETLKASQNSFDSSYVCSLRNL